MSRRRAALVIALDHASEVPLHEQAVSGTVEATPDPAFARDAA